MKGVDGVWGTEEVSVDLGADNGRKWEVRGGSRDGDDYSRGV